MGYYANLHISRQQDYDHFDCSEWGDMNEYLLEDLCAELEICNERRPKDRNDPYFAAGLTRATALREQIEKIKYKNAYNNPTKISSVLILNLRLLDPLKVKIFAL